MTTRARTARKPAAKPADPDVTTVEFRGEKFTFPTSRAEWPTRAHQAFQRSDNADGVELLLGPTQWNRLNAIAPKMRDFWEFFFGPFLAAARPKTDEDEADDKAEADDAGEG